MFEKSPKIITILILSVIVLFIIFVAAWYVLAKKLPKALENLSAKRETVNLLKIKQGMADSAMQKKIVDIESRINQEETEYNEAKRQEELKRRQYDILAFENSLSAVEKLAKDAYSAQEKIMAQWKIGNVTNSEAYETTNSAKEQCEKAKKEARFIRVPESLPLPVGELLEKARSDLISDYSKKTEAMDYLLKFIDDNKPSYQHKFNEAIKASREFSTSAVLNIIEAKRKAGIDLFKVNPANLDELQKTKYSYTISGIFYSEKNPFVFINEKVYYINDALGGGKIIKILPNKVVIRFIDYEKEYRVGDVFTR